MPKSTDKQNKSPKRDKFISRSKRRDDKIKKRKELSSDSDSDNSESIDDSEEEEINTLHYRKFLAKLFPSKFINNRVKELIDDEDEDEDDEEEEYVPLRRSKHSQKNKKERNKKRVIESSESEEDEEEYYDDDEDYDEDEDYDDEDYYEDDIDEKKINIVLTLRDLKKAKSDLLEDEESEESEETYDEDDEEESEEEQDNSKKSKNIKDELDKEIDELTNNINELVDSIQETDAKPQEMNTLSDKDILINFIKQGKQLQKHNDNKIIEELIQIARNKYKEIKKKDEKLSKKTKLKNLQKFRKNITEKNSSNDYAYFNKLSLEEQDNMLSELEVISKQVNHDKPYRVALLESKIPTKFKAAALKKINGLNANLINQPR